MFTVGFFWSNQEKRVWSGDYFSLATRSCPALEGAPHKAVSGRKCRSPSKLTVWLGFGNLELCTLFSPLIWVSWHKNNWASTKRLHVGGGALCFPLPTLVVTLPLLPTPWRAVRMELLQALKNRLSWGLPWSREHQASKTDHLLLQGCLTKGKENI